VNSGNNLSILGCVHVTVTAGLPCWPGWHETHMQVGRNVLSLHLDALNLPAIC
jgi:hypothetical protein